MEKLECLKGKYSIITDVRGRGLLIAIGLTQSISENLKNACLKEGLLVNNVQPDALRFMPPLIVTKKDIDKALSILDKVFSRY